MTASEINATSTPAAAPPGAPVPATGLSGPRAAAERTVSGNTTTVNIGGSKLELPPKDQLAFLVGLGGLALLDLVEWPVVVAIAVGHELARNRHHKALREFGEALEEV